MKVVYLLGFRGAGKTTLGRAAALEMGWDFIDLDDSWEKQNGSIEAYVALKGEAAFRAAEASFLAAFELSIAEGQGAGLLVGTGGGLLESEAARKILLQSRHPKIYLEVEAEELWRRLEPLPQRRVLGALRDENALKALLARRRPFYEKIANYSVKNQDITASLTELKRLLGQV
jgi:shikimate kinase